MDTTPNKPTPNENTIIVGAKIILAYGHFNWNELDGLQLGKQASVKFKTWIDKAVKQNQLIRGSWNKKTWIGYTVLSRLVRAYLVRALEHGTTSWDVTIARCLSIVLVGSLGARTGDVGRSRQYTGTEYMQYRHIELTIDGEPEFGNLRARITIEFAKGLKDRMNQETVHFLRPLNESHDNHVCPIALLLVHSLRHSMVAGTTLQEVLNLAFQRQDRRIVWLFPQRPVLPAFANSPLRCELDKPASPGQMLISIRKMGLVAGMLDRAYGHALRHGAARDLAHLPTGSFEGSGVATDSVRQSIGHTQKTMAAGVTEHYVGGSSAELYNSRAANPRTNRLEPQFAALDVVQPLALVNAPVSEEEITLAISKSKVKRKEGISRKAAIEQVRADRARNLRTTMDCEQRGATMNTLMDASPLPSASTAQTRIPLAAKDANAPLAPAVPSNESLDPIRYQKLDPAMLNDEELVAMAEGIPATAAKELHDLVMSAAGTTDREAADSLFVLEDRVEMDQLSEADHQAALSSAVDPEVEESASLLLGADLEAVQVAVSSADWVTTYAAYNIIDNYYFARLWTKHCINTQQPPEDENFTAIFDKYCTQGGSRNAPSPFIHACRKSNGCLFTTIDPDALRSHEAHCSNAKAELLSASVQKLASGPAEFICTYEGCDFAPAPFVEHPEQLLAAHVRNVHKWQAKPCEQGCEPDKLYYSESRYQYHISTKHSGRWPAKCSYPACEHPTKFVNLAGLKAHLKNTHKLDDAALTPYVPARPDRKQWIGQGCFLAYCDASFKQRAKQQKHLMDEHQMSAEQAKAAIDEKGQFEMVGRASVIGRKRVPTNKQTKRALEQGIAGPSKKKAT